MEPIKKHSLLEIKSLEVLKAVHLQNQENKKKLKLIQIYIMM
jgi:hypothetical protein